MNDETKKKMDPETEALMLVVNDAWNTGRGFLPRRIAEAVIKAGYTRAKPGGG